MDWSLESFGRDSEGNDLLMARRAPSWFGVRHQETQGRITLPSLAWKRPRFRCNKLMLFGKVILMLEAEGGRGAGGRPFLELILEPL